jgi:hypothetical protein
MAVHAGEHAAVDGVFEFLGINVKADRLAIDFMRQGCVAVAGKALINSWLWSLFLGRTLKSARG